MINAQGGERCLVQEDEERFPLRKRTKNLTNGSRWIRLLSKREGKL